MVTMVMMGLRSDFARSSLLSLLFLVLFAVFGDLPFGSNHFARANTASPQPSWNEMQTIYPNTFVAGMRFGQAVSIANTSALVSAPFQNIGSLGNAGAVYYFTRSTISNVWTQTQKIQMPTPYAEAQFGTSVSVSDKHGVVGCERCTLDNSVSYYGTVFIYYVSGNQLIFQQRMDGFYSGQHLGVIVWVNGIVKASSSPTTNNLYTFTWNGGSWVQDGGPVTGTITANTQTSKYKINGDPANNRAFIQFNSAVISFTRTNSKSRSKSQSRSRSRSRSRSPSRSRSRSNSKSRSRSNSKSRSRSNSKSRSRSNSKSRSRSNSKSRSHSRSRSRSPSRSRSRSNSKSRSRSNSKSRSRSNSKSRSRSNSKSRSRSRSPSRSRSRSNSRSRSRSNSKSRSRSNSKSRSRSNSKSQSHSNSMSRSRSTSPSRSRSLSKSQSRSISGSRSLTRSPSRSGSRTQSLNQSRTKSVSKTRSYSRSLSASKSNSRSNSRSRSHSQSQSRSKSYSKSYSRSQSNTRSRSRSLTLSMSRSKSNSRSNSRTRSASRSQSNTRSRSSSPSQSLNESRTISASKSQSHSQSQSRSRSLSNSHSRSRSLTLSMSRSKSNSRSNSRTRSASRSQSNTRSRSSSPSQSLNESRTISASKSQSYTQSQSRSRSQSNTRSRSSSPSQSLNESLTISASKSQSHSQSQSHSRSQSNTPSRSNSRTQSRSKSRSKSRSRSQSRSFSIPPPTTCSENDPPHIYVACYIPKVLTPMVQTRRFANVTSEIIRLSKLLNSELGTSQDLPGSTSRLQSRAQMNDYLKTSITNRFNTHPSQQPNLTNLISGAFFLYYDLSGFVQGSLLVACENAFAMATFGSVEGLNTADAANLMTLSSMVSSRMVSLNGASCNLKEINNLICQGLLKTSEGGPVTVVTNTGGIYTEKTSPKNASKTIVIGGGVSVNITNSTGLQNANTTTVTIRVITSTVNPHTSNNTGDYDDSVASPVITIEVIGDDGGAVDTNSNQTVITITFTGNETYVPVDDTRKPGNGFMYQGFQPDVCIYSTPTCKTWNENATRWVGDGLTYQSAKNKDKDFYQAVCSSTHLSDFVIFLEPIQPLSACSNSWVVDQDVLFAVYSAVYGVFLIAIVYQLYVLINSFLQRTKRINPAPLIIHIGALALVILRLVYFIIAATDSLSSISRTGLLVLVSLPFFFLYTVHSLMAFLWLDALLSDSIVGGFLRKSRYYFFGGLSLVLLNLVITWIMFAAAPEDSMDIISMYGSISLAVISIALAVLFLVFGLRIARRLQAAASNRTALVNKIIRIQTGSTTFFIFNAASLIFNNFEYEILFNHFGIVYSFYLFLECASLGTILHGMRAVPQTPQHSKIQDRSSEMKTYYND